MSEIKRCENCGNENILIINRFKGHYSCGKCGRDTEKLYEIEHDAEIRAKTIEEFAERCKDHILCKTFGLKQRNIEEIAEQLKGEI